MTAHVHDHPDVSIQSSQRRQLPRWLMPGLLIAIVAVALVVAGIVPITTMFYAGVFGAMLLMHAGGHGGHGSHGGHSQHGDHMSDEPKDPPDDEAGNPPGARGCH